jgi:hypothetical protein
MGLLLAAPLRNNSLAAACAHGFLVQNVDKLQFCHKATAAMLFWYRGMRGKRRAKMPVSSHLSKRFPVGTKYVLEKRGPLVRRYVELPDGRRFQLSTRKALTCTCADTSIAPEQLVEPVDATM